MMRRWLRKASQQLASKRDESSPSCVSEIAEVADADETSGKYMLAEAAQELACGERHDPLLVAVGVVFPSEAYVVTIEAEQALVADGNAVRISVNTRLPSASIQLIDQPCMKWRKTISPQSSPNSPKPAAAPNAKCIFDSLGSQATEMIAIIKRPWKPAFLPSEDKSRCKLEMRKSKALSPFTEERAFVMVLRLLLLLGVC